MSGGTGAARGRWALAIVVGLVASFVVPRAVDAAPNGYACGAKDSPETGIHGDIPPADLLSGRAAQGYSCGLALVGYSSLGQRGGNANMAWSGDCAYIAGEGVAVVDVHDPTHPRLVRTLHTGGSEATVETLNAIDAPDRHILVTGRYGIGGMDDGAGQAPVDVWDVSDCTKPKQLSTIAFPANVHNLTLTADGKRVWSTLPLRAADISDPRHPKVLPRIEPQLAASGAVHLAYAHEAWPSPDNTRLYVGNQGIPNDYEDLLVIDTTKWPQRPARVLGSAPVAGHSIRPMRIKGKPYLLADDESILNPTAKGCLPDLLNPFGGVSRPHLVDLSTEHNPIIRSRLVVPIGDPTHCPQQLLSGINPSVHYNDVDNADDTTFAMVSAWNSGLRLFDVRNPDRPREVAYFNPGVFPFHLPTGTPGVGTFTGLTNPQGYDQAWAHIRYREDKGQIWLTTSTGGFWVLELEPQLRAALGLSSRSTLHPQGAPVRPAATHWNPAGANAALTATYCAISTARIL